MNVKPNGSIEERELAERCRSGELAACRELYDRYAGRLMSVCLRYAGDRVAAEDLLHDAFLKIYGNLDRFSYRGPGSLRAWMERVTVNLAIEWLRARKRMVFRPFDEIRDLSGETDPEPDAAAAAALSPEILMRFVGELPDGYRTVFNLYCIEGYSHREIAGMLGINEKSSSSQLFRARRMLGRKIREYCEIQADYETK